MAANPGFQISLDVRGWPVLVIGGNEEATDKVERLLEAGAKVTVISPTSSALPAKSSPRPTFMTRSPGSNVGSAG